MIRYHQSGEQVNVRVEKERAPSIYLDQSALFQFSRPSALRDALLQTFETRGEIMFSHANMMEVGVLRGKSAEHVRSYCAAIGPHWIPVELMRSRSQLTNLSRHAGRATRHSPALAGVHLSHRTERYADHAD